jgi:hypothetical protein
MGIALVHERLAAVAAAEHYQEEYRVDKSFHKLVFILV